ncbi:solute carrier family 46 member 3 [Cyclopterus lumpus]|uniref:Solute carrier family 46 member 3 n=1 Tax=Cyclopterus lumpus TaxID=8103 RepID=A0A8C2ZVK6_CYCLU|nr:solute carrier family 46 member 3 [Cyclopterus lumpus]
MKGLFLVEPVVALYAFSSFLIYPLVQQYVYRRLWQELTHTPYPISDNASRCADNNNSSSNQSSYHEEVQRQASLFTLYTELFSTIPSLVVTLLLVAYSDRGGRKVTIVMPLIGTLIYTLALLSVSYFELNIYLLIAASFFSSLFGGLGTFLGGCFAYIADLCEDGRQKTLRMAGVDMMIGLLSGVAAISTGYFLRAAGFNWPFITSALCQCLNLLFAIFILEETVTNTNAVISDGSPHRSAMKQMIYGVYYMFARASHKNKTLLVLLILIFISFSFAYVGGSSIMTLYELNKPLCWSEILIGYGTAMSTTMFLASFVVVSAFTYWGVPQLVIVLTGILSVISGMVLLAFAKTTFLMFMVRVPMLLSIMPFPVLRSMTSKIISKSDQGALFACLSFLESLTTNVSTAVFNSVYAATLAWYPGFTFLLSAGLCVIPLLILGAVGLTGLDVAEEVKDQEPLFQGVEDIVEDQNSNHSVLT